MSTQALIFAEGYRGGRLVTSESMGHERLVGGQHEAIWANDERTAIEVSWAHQLGHEFYVVMLDSEDLRAMALMKVGIFGQMQERVPEDFVLSEEMLVAVARLRSEGAVSDQAG